MSGLEKECPTSHDLVFKVLTSGASVPWFNPNSFHILFSSKCILKMVDKKQRTHLKRIVCCQHTQIQLKIKLTRCAVKGRQQACFTKKQTGTKQTFEIMT